MNKARDKKKDITRALKAMKLQASTRYYDTINDNGSRNNSIENKIAQKKLIYTSIKKTNQEGKQAKRRSLRYDRNVTQNQPIYGGIYYQERSLEIKSDNFFKVSQKIPQNQTLSRNPYQPRSRIGSVSKQLRRSSQQPRRLFTQQSTKPQPLRKTIHLKTIQALQPLNIGNMTDEARTLSNSGCLAQSQTIIQRILRQDPQNRQALYMSGVNNYKQMNYLKSLISFNKLLQLDPLFNKSAYVMSSICYSNKGKKQEAMQKVNACLMYFPDFYDAYYQKAKLYLKDDDNQNAIKNLKKALKLAKDPYQCCLKLGQCYEKSNMLQLSVKLYDHVIKKDTTNKNNKCKNLCYLKKAQIEKKIQKYDDYIETLKQYLSCVNPNEGVNLAKIHLEIGYAYFKLEDYPNATMSLEQVFQQKNRNQSTEALILLTLVNIKKRDFYQAYHCLLRKDHLQINQKQLHFYQKFCQGVLSLMKRKFQVGLQRLLQIESKTFQKSINQLQQQIITIFPMYLSYAYFCLGRTDKCIQINKKILQKNQPKLTMYRKGIEFNQSLCEGIEQFKCNRIGQAKLIFQRSIQIYPNKPEGFLYLGITLILLYLKNFTQSVLKRAKVILTACIQNLKQLNNNYAASAFYVKAALSAFLGDWDLAINQIDQSIQRAQDNDPKSFYLRALILACCQNFKQAIGEVSIAISLNDKEPKYYLLRSKCQQIEGDGNRAFLDLQQYIALAPDDSQIHKFAGHLLFQNGAFEDAIQAYENGEISVDIPNYDVFLTRSKTYFLLGDFEKCVEDMQTANKLRPNQPNITFDISVIRILQQFFSNDKLNNFVPEKADKAHQQLQNVAAIGQQIDYGKIFKKLQITMLLALILFQMGKYRESARQFKQTITMRQIIININQSQYEEQLKEKQFFTAQMNYNRAICFLMLAQQGAAVKALQQSSIESDSKTHQRMIQLLQILRNQKIQSKQIQVFSQKNKMSRLLKLNTINLKNGSVIKMRLCIPYPKVQPPQINPKFQIRIMRELDIDAIQKKPEAPWILRQQNSIKFTQKIQQFSRLQINASELSKAEKKEKQKQQLGTQQQEEMSYEEPSRQSLTELKQKLKLDDQIENKLKKLLNKHR